MRLLADASTLLGLDSADSKFYLLLLALLTQLSLIVVNMQTDSIIRFLKDAGLYQKDKKKDSKESGL